MAESDKKAESPNEEFEEKQSNTKGYMTVVGAVLIMMFCGSFFLWANISVYVLSYLHMKNEESGHKHPDVNESSIYYVDLALVALNCAGYNIGSFLL